MGGWSGVVSSFHLHVSLFAFMGAMLGVTLADNILALFVFLELTGFASYLLIGFEHGRPEARRAGLQALLVTAADGLALLAAGLISDAGGTSSLTSLVRGGSRLTGHSGYVAITVLILLAAFTTSAQFPFQFWLPNQCRRRRR
jgi:multicomponent Na+:H+ antiporter subunit A